MDIKTYILHYTKLIERKKNLLEIFKENLDKIEFIEEFDKEDITPELLNFFYDRDEKGYYEKIRNLWDLSFSFRILNDAEISCTIKHIEALRRISLQNEEYCLILEDDVVPLSIKFKEEIVNLIRSTDTYWDAIFIGEGCGYEFINQKKMNAKAINENLFEVQHPKTNCAEAFIIKKEAAKKIYDSIIPFHLVSDWELAYQFYKLNMTVYWAEIPIFRQGSKCGLYNSELR